jgi:cytochrome c nitrite reductase small subunit
LVVLLSNGNRRLTVLAVLAGTFAGAGLFTFAYAQGFSYLSSQPEACANCHVMNDEYAGWNMASHHAVATCVECHLPHRLDRKLLAKAENGYHHSKGFTLQNFHEPILIKPTNDAILQERCLSCHLDMVSALAVESTADRGLPRCARCHAGVGHGSGL